MSVSNPNDPVFAPGPWEHRTVHAHGQRFHVATMGEGPLVILLHGFPTYWWLWRNQLEPIAKLGFKVAALDMRGYGGSDQPPRGYDPRTLAADVTGVIRALGHRDAVIIGHGYGGLIAWTAATLQKSLVRGIGIVSSAHPNSLRKATVSNPSQAKALSFAVAMQRPWIAERALVKNNAEEISKIVTAWAKPQVLDPAVVSNYQAAFQRGNTAYSACEIHRWAMRSIPRLDGRRFAADMDVEVTIPVLQIHGANDEVILLDTSLASEKYVAGPYEFIEIPSANHLLPETHCSELSEYIGAWLEQFASDAK